MTHIGYIKSIHAEYGFGIVIDALKMAHCFALAPEHNYKTNTFVSFEGDGVLITDIISLDCYPRFQRYQPNMNFYLQDGVGSWYKYFLVNNKGERYSLDGAEAFVVRQLFEGKPLFPLQIEPISYDDYSKQVEEIFNKVEYVSTHLQEIANSYEVEIKVSHICKIGGDDRFYTDRVVSLLYRDKYLSKFFLESEQLDKQCAYTSHYDYPFGEGRKFDEEQIGKQAFLSGYDKMAHYSTLLFELNQQLSDKDRLIKENIIDWTKYWGFDLSRRNFEWIINGQATTIEIAIEQIEKYNKKNMMLMK